LSSHLSLTTKVAKISKVAKFQVFVIIVTFVVGSATAQYLLGVEQRELTC